MTPSNLFLRRALPVGLAAVVVVAAGSPSPAGAAQPVTPSVTICTRSPAQSPAQSTAPTDVNGDGYGEVAVSSAGVRNSGAVSVFYGQRDAVVVDAVGTALDDQYLDQNSPGIPGTAAARHRFGAATAFGDFNADGCADLAVGAPGDGTGGSVTVLYGSPRGLRTDTARQLIPPAAVALSAGAEFGTSLTTADLTGDGVADLAVGAPSQRVAGRADAGAVFVYRGGRTGIGTEAPRRYSQGSSGVPGPVGTAQFFGAVLTAGNFDGTGPAELAVGIQGEVSTDGAVQILAYNPPGGRQSAAITPATLGYPTGENEGYGIQSFGESLAAGDVTGDGRDDLAVGAPSTTPPDPEPNNTSSGGAVFILPGSATGPTGTGRQVWSQANVGVPDPEIDPHRFGASLAFGRFDAGPTLDLAIGEPEDELRTGDIEGNIGSVTVLFGRTGGLSAQGSRYLHQGVPHVVGRPEDGDEFGLSVAAVTLRRDGRQALIVGSPGDRLGGLRRTGRIHQFGLADTGPQGAGSRALDLGSAGVKGTPRVESRFGLAIDGPSATLY